MASDHPVVRVRSGARSGNAWTSHKESTPRDLRYDTLYGGDEPWDKPYLTSPSHPLILAEWQDLYSRGWRDYQVFVLRREVPDLAAFLLGQVNDEDLPRMLQVISDRMNTPAETAVGG
jgi:hypothetical protein